MRVFLAATLDDLETLRESGRIGSPLTGFAALPLLVERLGLEGEELDLALALAAADGSRDAALDSGLAVGRRLVVVAELPESSVRVESPSEGEVAVPDGVELSRVDAFLADAVPLELAVADHEELAWFGSQELDLLT
jgi:hypothetical protein